jgi:hypothetical protein
MNGYYVDCPNMVNFPFAKEDFFTQYDMDILHGRVKGDDILGSNLSQLRGAVGESENKRHDSSFIKTSKCSWSKNTGKYDAQGTFNGNGIVTDHNLKHDIWDWLNESFHKDYFQMIWKAGGTNTPPVTVLCFSLNSGWHNEGPISAIPGSTLPQFNNFLRPPAVINFKLLGDVDNSYIEFAEPDVAMKVAQKELIELYLEKVQYEKAHGSLEADTSTVVEHKNFILSSSIHGYYDDYWSDNLKVVETHHGMHNPYIVNIGKWHRVITNGQPRVTLRVHANTHLTFQKIEELVARGEFFKC